MFHVQNITSLFLNVSQISLMKRVFSFLSDAFAMEKVDLISRVHLALFVTPTVIPKY
jgi:hypothetical protein